MKEKQVSLAAVLREDMKYLVVLCNIRIFHIKISLHNEVIGKLYRAFNGFFISRGFQEKVIERIG